MRINGVHLDDTFAEAFGMRATRVLITAHNLKWAYHAANAATGFATSVIACGAEAGVERKLDPSETPDGRPGAAILLFATSSKELGRQLERRIGQCVLTCPTTAAFSGLESTEQLPLGKDFALLRRRPTDLQAHRRQALLALTGDGRRVLVRGNHRHGARRRRRQLSCAGRTSGRGTRRLSKRPSRQCAGCRT